MVLGHWSCGSVRVVSAAWKISVANVFIMNDVTQKPLPKSGTLNKELYFPTQIYFRDIPKVEAINKTLKRDIYSWRETDVEGIVRSNVKQAGSWHSTVDMHTRPEFQEFRRMVTETMQNIYTDLGYDPDYRPECDNMWANINPRNGFNRHHTHPNVLWSGVYYVHTPENCGRLYFSDPRVQAQVMPPRYIPGQDRTQRETWSEVHYEAVAGRILFFPGWLGHEVQPNLSELEGEAGDRISISFNYFQTKRDPT